MFCDFIDKVLSHFGGALMHTVYPEYDHDLSSEQNMKNLLVYEIERLLPSDLIRQKDPYIFIRAINQLIIDKKLALIFHVNKKSYITIKLSEAQKEFFHLLNNDKICKAKNMFQEEFVDHLVDKLLPTTGYGLMLLRDD